jgi:hypothetical protein
MWRIAAGDEATPVSLKAAAYTFTEIEPHLSRPFTLITTLRPSQFFIFFILSSNGSV